MNTALAYRRDYPKADSDPGRHRVLIVPSSGLTDSNASSDVTPPESSASAGNLSEKVISRNQLKQLLDIDPELLLLLIECGHLQPSVLTYAAEFAGNISNSKRVRKALTPLLDHSSPMVREGALYGLADHLDSELKKVIAEIVRHDKSPGVKSTAEDILLG